MCCPIQGLNPGNWQEIYRSSKPVSDGVLFAGFDTTKLNEGDYIVKLVVIDNDGTKNQDRALIKVNNFEITAIGDNLNYIKGKVKVKGKIYLTPSQGYPVGGTYGMSSVEEYKVEYKNQQGSWITLCHKSNYLPLNDELCTIDVSSFPNGLYEFLLSILVDDKEWKFDEPFKAVVVQELIDGWPVEFDGFYRGPHKVADFSGSKGKITMVPYHVDCFQNVCWGSKLVFIESNGKYNSLSYLNDGTLISGIDNMSVIYFDKNLKESLIGTIDYRDRGDIKIFNKGGVVKHKMDLSSIPPNFSPLVLSHITALDTDQDGRLEFYTYFIDDSTGQIRIYGFDESGRLLDKFKISIERKNKNFDGFLLLKQMIFLKQGNDYNLATIASDFNYATDTWGIHLDLYLDI